MWVPSLGQEDPLEKGMANHHSTLAWKIPWTEKPGGLLSIRSQRVGHDWSDLTCTIRYLLKILYYNLHMKESESEAAQSCPTLCDPMNYSLAGSFVLGIFQAGVLEWVTTSFSRGSSQPRDWTLPPTLQANAFAVRATRDFTHRVVNDITQLCCLVEFTVWAVLPCFHRAREEALTSTLTAWELGGNSNRMSSTWFWTSDVC